MFGVSYLADDLVSSRHARYVYNLNTVLVGSLL